MRETVRDALVVLLTAGMVGANRAKTCVGYKLEDIVGYEPVVSVESAGTDRSRLTFGVDLPTFDFKVVIYTPMATTGWTNAQAMDMVDLLESLLADVIEANKCTTDWSFIEYTDTSEIEEITERTGGARYYQETVSIRVHVE